MEIVEQRKENSYKLTTGAWEFQALRHDPYGFWTISGRRGKEKIEIPGEYTSTSEVKRAISTYISKDDVQPAVK